ncbi:MAG: GGDEF domain-containing protein [Gammaproteobacteria bacterium]
MLVLAIGNIGFAIVMGAYAHGGADNPALRLWRGAKLIQGLGHYFAWLEWTGPPMQGALWLEGAANTALMLGVMAEAGAYCHFFGCHHWRRPLYLLCVLALVGYHVATLGGMAQAHVTAMMTLMFAMLAAIRAFMLLRRRATSLLQAIVGLTDVLFCAVMCARAWEGLAPSRMSLFDADALLVLTWSVCYLLMIVNSFGFVLLCKAKDDTALAHLATVDSLTGLLNRRAFFEATERARAQAQRQQQSVALMMLDIDYFKRLNDRYGHAAGDGALCAFARTAESTLRERDILGRLGGEEFALLLPATDLMGAMQAAERLRAAVEMSPLSIEGQPVVLTVSIGLVMVDADEAISTALARADHALYTAKSGGRNRVEVGLIKRRAPGGGE